MAIVALGSVNADFQVRVERSPDGPGAVAATDFLRASGGKAANVAVLARRLGADAVLLGCVGDDDLAAQALDGPRRAGVDISGVRRAPGPTGMACIMVEPGGDKTIVLALNANDAWAGDAGAVADGMSRVDPSSVLVADLEVPVDVALAAVEAAKRRGIAVVVDPAPPERAADHLLSASDHLTPDHREATALTGVDASRPGGALAAAEGLHRRGGAAVYVKLPDGGCAVAAPGVRAVVRSPDGLDVVDATGAGDAFAGGLAWALHSGRDVAGAAVLAVAASSCAVQAYGSQSSYPNRSQLLAMAGRVSVGGP